MRRSEKIQVTLFGKVYTTVDGARRRMGVEKERIENLRESLSRTDLTKRQRYNLERMLPEYEKAYAMASAKFNGECIVSHINNFDDFKGFM